MKSPVMLILLQRVYMGCEMHHEKDLDVNLDLPQNVRIDVSDN